MGARFVDEIKALSGAIRPDLRFSRALVGSDAICGPLQAAAVRLHSDTVASSLFAGSHKQKSFRIYYHSNFSFHPASGFGGVTGEKFLAKSLSRERSD